jgi:2-dehydro-3-deoxygluconokinase
MALDLVGFGEAMVLVAPADGEPLDATRAAGLHVAGAELNVCAAAAALGARTAFASRVGDDPLGRRVRAAAAALGIGTSLLSVDSGAPTGVFFRDVQPDGQRRVYYYRAGSAAAAMDASDAERILASRPSTVVVSGITASLGPGPHAAVTTLLRHARAAGVRVALDPNLRPALGPVPDQVTRLLPLLPCVDTLLLGTDEAPHLFGTNDPDGVFVAAAAAGVGETVLKAGPDGCYVPASGRPRHLLTAATVVVDPVGAGDAFAGGYLTARARGLSAVAAAWLGNRLAAGVVANPGDTAGLPDEAAAQALLARAAQLP